MQADTTPPVLIAGAGPCGLVAALTLQKQGVPFVVVERASREKLCANVGSGYDLAPTAIGILTNRLGLDVDEIFSEYAGMYVQDMAGKVVCDVDMDALLKNATFLKDSKVPPKYGSVNRADLQKLLLKALFPSQEDEAARLRCGVSVESYETNSKDDGATTVTAHLSDGSSLEGRVLFGCDGIHSAIRKQMHRGRDDALHFCSAVIYWAKCPVVEGSGLDLAFKSTQSLATTKGSSFVMTLGSGRHPGSFMLGPANNQLVWALAFQADSPPGERTDDLTRRGGKIIDDAAKQDLAKKMEGRCELLQLCLEATDAAKITMAGLFDREDNTLPYVDPEGHVVLMGDSAHPQSPFICQGCNMAIVDAFVASTRVAKNASIPDALARFDTKERKESVRKVVEQARTQGSSCVTSSRFSGRVMKMVFKWLPLSWFATDMVNGDKSNHDFLASLDCDYPDVAA